MIIAATLKYSRVHISKITLCSFFGYIIRVKYLGCGFTWCVCIFNYILVTHQVPQMAKFLLSSYRNVNSSLILSPQKINFSLTKTGQSNFQSIVLNCIPYQTASVCLVNLQFLFQYPEYGHNMGMYSMVAGYTLLQNQHLYTGPDLSLVSQSHPVHISKSVYHHHYKYLSVYQHQHLQLYKN